MKPLLFFSALLLPVVPLAAQIIGVEGFDGGDGALANRTGGTGFNYDNFDGAVTTTTSDWDNVDGAPGVNSGALVTNNSSVKREYNGNIEGAGGVPNDGQDNHERSGAVRGVGQVFYRFEMTRSAGAIWGGASSYDFGAERVFFGVPGVPGGTGGLEFGVEVSGGGPLYHSGIPADANPHAIVAVLDFDNQQVGLWLDPDGGDFYDVADGSHSADVMGAYAGTNWSTAVRLGSGGQVTWDNLTVALDPADVGLGSGVVDLDNDGLPGSWEAANGLDDNDDGTTDPDNGATGDPDGDGLDNAGELANGTDPQEEDSDDDGFNDGDEIAAGTNPTNSASFPGADPEPNLVGIDQFDYPDGAIANETGGQHWDFDNSTESDAFTGHSGTVSDWDATSGTPQVASGVLLTNNSSAKREYNGPGEGFGLNDDERFGAIGQEGFLEQNVVYYTFTMTRRAGATWGGASSFDFGVERYLFGVPNAANPVSGAREFAIHDLNTDSHAYSGVQPVFDQTYTLVAKLDFANDVAALYLDPDLSQPEATNSPAATYPHTSTNWSTAIRFGSGGSGDVEWDDLRVATTWDALLERPPAANPDVATMHHGAKARIAVLANDTGSISPGSVTVTTPPSHGTALVSSDGTILYEHTGGMVAGDSFSYQVANAGGTLDSTASVTIDFSTAARFDTDYVNMPATPPATPLQVEDAFPGITFDSPHDFGAIPGDATKLLVTEGDGRVFMVSDIDTASPLKTLILDITSQITHDNNEIAMKGIAAHPDWVNNGYVYVTYNSGAGTVRLSRFTCQTTAPFAAESELILIDQTNRDIFHNIATCRFGADGYLYAGFGDEGTQNDGWDNSQHIDKDLWSCIIRIDVDKDPANLVPNDDPLIPRVGGGSSGEAHFRVPADNPFVGATSFNGVAVNAAEVRTEIFITGQRNPWQISPEDNDGNGTVDEVWVGDVGRSDREEVAVYTAGLNGGWAWREGTIPGIRSGQLINGAAEAAASLTGPLWEYTHGGGAFQGNSVTGGFVYRGTALPELTDKYVFADYVSGNIWSLERTQPEPTVERLAGEVAIVALTTDPSSGDILLLDRGNTGANQGVGSIKRLTLGSDDTGFPATLSSTNFFADLGDLTANPGGVSYDLNLRFWSDHAEKARWFLVNDTTDTVGFSRENPWTYPEGMVWVKHFEYPTSWETFSRIVNGQVRTDRRPTAGAPRRRLETRFLVRTADGAYGVSYRWNNLNGGTQDEAILSPDSGENFSIDVTVDGAPDTHVWEIPSRTACLACHTPEAGHALSFNTRQLNIEDSIVGVSGNVLSLLSGTGYLDGLTESPAALPRHIRPDETAYSLEARVRSYLDVNCAYCHQASATGGGNWDGRSLLTLSETGLVNTVSVDAPINPGDLLVIPGDVDHSILYNRAAAANGYSRMPPLASNVIDLEGAQLIADWIAGEMQSTSTYQEWRILHFGSATSPEGEPGANPDGDNANNEFEWLTNTDPNNRASIWDPVIRQDGGVVAVDFGGLGNRSVTVLRSTDLQSWTAWSVAGNDGVPRPSGTPQTLSAPRVSVQEFFRFEVRER